MQKITAYVFVSIPFKKGSVLKASAVICRIISLIPSAHHIDLLIIIFTRVINTFLYTFATIITLIINNRRIKAVLILYKRNMFTKITGITPCTNARVNDSRNIIHEKFPPYIPI